MCSGVKHFICQLALNEWPGERGCLVGEFNSPHLSHGVASCITQTPALITEFGGIWCRERLSRIWWKRGTACNREDGRIRHIWGYSSTPSAAKAPVSGAGAEGRVEGKLVCGRCVIHTGSSVSNVPLAFPLSLRISEPSQATATGFGAIWTRLPLSDPAGRFWQVWSQGLSGI